MRLDVGIRAVEEPACTLGGRTLSRPDFPVCSPELAERLRLNDVSDLSRCRLLYDSAWNGDWMLWCKTAQVPDRSLNRELGFSLHTMAVEPALQGQGVLLGHAALLEGELTSGRRVEPFEVRAEAPHRYAAIYPANKVVPECVERFLTWLRGEVAPGDRAH
jgi:LysR family glycine cleavage system transcriptional activator